MIQRTTIDNIRDIVIGVFVGVASVAIGIAIGISFANVDKQKHIAYIKPINYICFDGVPEQYKDRMAEAISAWDKSLHNYYSFIPAFNNEFSCDYTIKVTNETHESNSSALGWANLGGKIVYLKQGRYEFDPGAVVLHELGHAIGGCSHYPGTIMNDRVYSIQRGTELCVDHITALQAAAYNHIDIDRLYWCE
jgi:hypothetical protein